MWSTEAWPGCSAQICERCWRRVMTYDSECLGSCPGFTTVIVQVHDLNLLLSDPLWLYGESTSKFSYNYYTSKSSVMSVIQPLFMWWLLCRVCEVWQEPRQCSGKAGRRETEGSR
jgi:hypothetical protein